MDDSNTNKNNNIVKEKQRERERESERENNNNSHENFKTNKSSGNLIFFISHGRDETKDIYYNKKEEDKKKTE